MNNPLISIVIPVYNGANYMREAIDSALAQTYKNIEVIVINDGSTDDTDGIAKSYGDKIRYFAKENGGVGSALNLALKHMQGDYFSWLSHDDAYYPEKLEKQITFLSTLKDKSVVLYSDYDYMGETSDVIRAQVYDHVMLEGKPEYSVLRSSINGNTLLIPKRAFKDYGDFDEKLTCTQDYAKWFEMLKTYRFMHIPELLIKYRVHPGQDTQKNPKFITEGNTLWIKMMRELPLETKERLEGTEANFYNRMYKFLQGTPYKEATRYAKEAFSKAVQKNRNKRFSVAYVAHSAYTEGAEKAMINAIDGLLKRDVYVYVVLPFSGPLEKCLQERKVDYSFVENRFCTRSKGTSDIDIEAEIFENSLKLATLMQLIQPDVIVTVTSVINEGAIAARILGIPHVWSISEFGRKEHGIEYIMPEKERFQFIDEYSDKVFFVSDNLKKYYESIDQNKSFVFPPISSKELLESQTTSADNENFFKDKKSFKIALAGNIHEGKGQKDAILAVRELVKEGKENVELVVVGRISDEEYYQELKEIIARDDLNSHVSILPQIDNVAGLFLESDIVLMCSVYEAFGRVTAEAMLCRKPVIGANSGATPELIRDNETGLLYEPGDHKDLAKKIKFFVKNKDKIIKFGEHGYKIIEKKLDDKVNSDKYYKELSELKGKKKHPLELKGDILMEISTVLETKNREIDQKNRIIDKTSFELRSIKFSRIWRARNILIRALKKIGLR